MTGGSKADHEKSQNYYHDRIFPRCLRRMHSPDVIVGGKRTNEDRKKPGQSWQFSWAGQTDRECAARPIMTRGSQAIRTGSNQDKEALADHAVTSSSYRDMSQPGQSWEKESGHYC
jgi:hypothetical protein